MAQNVCSLPLRVVRNIVISPCEEELLLYSEEKILIDKSKTIAYRVQSKDENMNRFVITLKIILSFHADGVQHCRYNSSSFY